MEVEEVGQVEVEVDVEDVEDVEVDAFSASRLEDSEWPRSSC